MVWTEAAFTIGIFFFNKNKAEHLEKQTKKATHHGNVLTNPS